MNYCSFSRLTVTSAVITLSALAWDCGEGNSARPWKVASTH